MSNCGGLAARRAFFPTRHDDLDVVFAEAVEAETLAGAVDFSIGAHLGVAVFGGPFGDVGMEAFAIADDGREEKEVAALFHFGLEPPAELIAGLGLDGQLAIGQYCVPRRAKSRRMKW